MDGNPPELDPRVAAVFKDVSQPVRERLLLHLITEMAKWCGELEERLEALEEKDEPWRESLRPDGEDGENGE